MTGDVTGRTVARATATPAETRSVPVAVARLLIVHHTPSPGTHDLLDAVRTGASDPAIVGVEVVIRPALGATVPDVLAADGYLLGTPANFGYMSGALKDFFDRVYYPCLDATVGRPFGLWVHGNQDTEGAIRSVETIVRGLRWRRAAPIVSVRDRPTREALDACAELGAVLAAGLMPSDNPADPGRPDEG